jgi:uncharacterized membrane protein
LKAVAIVTGAADVGGLHHYVQLYAAGSVVTLLVAVVGYMIVRKRQFRFRNSIALGCALIGCYVLVCQIFKYYGNEDYLDFSVMEQVLHGIATGHGPVSSLQEGVIPGSGHWFGAHFTPLIYIFAVPFLFGFGPIGMLVLQFLFLMSSVPLLYMYSKKVTGSTHEALAIACLLPLYPTFQYIGLYEFELLRFALPALLLLFYMLETRNEAGYWLALALALLIREEVALTTALVGLYALIFRREVKLGVITMVVSVAYFLVVFELVMPHFRHGTGGHVAAYWFAQVGSTPGELLKNMVLHPLNVLRVMASPVKLGNLVLYLLPLAFIPLLGWELLLIAAANVGLNLLSGATEHTSYVLYYLTPTIAVIFVAFVHGFVRLKNFLARRRAVAGQAGDALLVPVYLALLSANLFFGPSPISLQFWLPNYSVAPFRTLNFHVSHYRMKPDDSALREVAAMVPLDGRVSAEQHIIPLLYKVATIKVFPDTSGVDYVLMNKNRVEKTGIGTVPGSWDGLRQHPQYYYDWIEKNPAWRVAVQRGGIFLYVRRGLPGAPTSTG